MLLILGPRPSSPFLAARVDVALHSLLTSLPLLAALLSHDTCRIIRTLYDMERLHSSTFLRLTISETSLQW